MRLARNNGARPWKVTPEQWGQALDDHPNRQSNPLSKRRVTDPLLFGIEPLGKPDGKLLRQFVLPFLFHRQNLLPI